MHILIHHKVDRIYSKFVAMFKHRTTVGTISIHYRGSVFMSPHRRTDALLTFVRHIKAAEKFLFLTTVISKGGTSGQMGS